MELNIDLLKGKREKSLFRVVFGILFCLCGSSRIFVTEVMKPFDWIYFGVFILGGISHLIEGLGYSIESFFGKAYILINSELISIKAGIFSKQQSVNWNEIESIDYKLNRFEVKKTDNTSMIINLSMLDYVSINEIKKTIDCIAKGKNIHSNL